MDARYQVEEVPFCSQIVECFYLGEPIFFICFIFGSCKSVVKLQENKGLQGSLLFGAYKAFWHRVDSVFI